jgi:ABC-type phosphate transport system permease subunit
VIEKIYETQTRIGFTKFQRRRFKEVLIEKFFLLNGLLAIVILLGIFSLLFVKGFPAIKELGWKSFQRHCMNQVLCDSLHGILSDR